MRGNDAYGDSLNDGWEDPEVHMWDTMCSGCALCDSWQGRTFEEIRSERRRYVKEKRATM
ncbi:hypothetical protein [Streptomyces inusitatus]|uniref:hypothetical protein n=1 Tax=Streptomyces inusitatus TaxID=68221 RepID=UPI00167CAF55|nr:hypothetical protein [Streptomyces inusitatus]